MRGDARWQSRDARPGKALPSILITDKWVIWSLPRFIGFDEKPWSTVISLPIQPLLWSISFDGKPCITMDIPLIPSLLWSIGFDGKPWSTVDVFARPAITVVHRFYNWASLWVLNPLCSLHAPPPIQWELILRKEVSQVSSSLISWNLVSGLCGFTFQAWEAAKGNGSGLYYFGSCLDIPNRGFLCLTCVSLGLLVCVWK